MNRECNAPPSASSPSSADQRQRARRVGRACPPAPVPLRPPASRPEARVTTWASCTSSPVGWMAMIGARFNSTTTGASADLIGSATSTGISTAREQDRSVGDLGELNRSAPSDRQTLRPSSCPDRTMPAALPAGRPVVRGRSSRFCRSLSGDSSESPEWSRRSQSRPH